MADTRTSRTLMNAKVALIFSILSILIAFFSRKFFLDALSSEVMGLRTTIGGFLGMLNLAELGIGTAIGVALYKPLHDKNYTAINEIVSIQGWLYRRVALVVTLGGAILSYFFPRFFQEMEAPLWYAYATFAVFLLSTLLSYTINYKTIVLSADQKGYKTSAVMSTATLLKSFAQMLILYYMEDPYAYWLGMELALSLVGVYVLDYITKREYPWLSLEVKKGREYLKKYPDILKQTGQIFLHSISTLVLGHATPMIIFAVSSLTIAGNYDNYKNLITNVRTISNTFFANLGPGVGNLIAEGNADKVYSFFWEVLSLKYFIAGICCFGLYVFASPFISLWLGEIYLLSPAVLFLLTLIAYIDFCRGAIDSYIVSYGLFKDVWAPIAEGGINLCLSLLFGIAMGWEGVLLGSLISLIAIVVIWKPYFLFTNGFYRSVKAYWLGVIKFPIITWALIIGGDLLVSMCAPSLSSFSSLFINASWIGLIFTFVLFSGFYLTSSGFRAMSKRLWSISLARVQNTRK